MNGIKLTSFLNPPSLYLKNVYRRDQRGTDILEKKTMASATLILHANLLDLRETHKLFFLVHRTPPDGCF